MITLSLDEYGDFENIKPEEKDAVLIAGVLFDDGGDILELGAEEKRIVAYYKKVAELANDKLNLNSSVNKVTVKFPDDLHMHVASSENTNDAIRKIGAYKEKVKETLGEFLTDGTLNGQPLGGIKKRIGKYYIYAIIKSEEGKSDRLSDTVSDLLNDNYGSNLYFHMVSEVILRTVFQNMIVKKGDEFNLKIASRSSATFDNVDDAERINKFISLGFEPITHRMKHVKLKDYNLDTETLEKLKGKSFYEFVPLFGGPGTRFQLTNSDVYRTVLAEHLSENNYSDIKLSEFLVKSITYDSSVGNEFLYLADSVCSVLSYELNKKGRNNAYAWMNEMLRRAEKLLPEDRLMIFAYDSIDVDYSAALDAYFQDDFYKALDISYDAIQKKGPFAEFYKNHWFKALRERMILTADRYTFTKAVNVLYDSQFSNTYIQGKGKYIRDTLEEMIPRLKLELKTPESQKIFFKFYEASLIAYNHLGDSEKAEEYFLKATAYAERAPYEEYIRARNTLAVTYCDNFKWLKAMDIARENVEYEKKALELKNSILESPSTSINVGLAKSLSQLGQVYSFLNTQDAEETFRDALRLFEEESADYQITKSYLLHHLIMRGEKEKYEFGAKNYFGGNENAEDQFAYILSQYGEKDPIISAKFAFFVFIKGLYTFRKDVISEGLWNSLKAFALEDEKKEKKFFVGHPAELSLKYLCLIAIDKKDNEILKVLESNLKKCLTEFDKLTVLIRLRSLAEVANGKGDLEERDKLTKQLATTLKQNFKLFGILLDLNQSEEQLYEVVGKYFRYMYD